jgi:leucine-zipper of insertion element IS481
VHAKSQHPNAVLTPEGRRRMVALVLDDVWSVEATAERFQVDAKTVRKWRDRFRAEGLRDRSCRPRSCPWSTPQALGTGSSICESGGAGDLRIRDELAAHHARASILRWLMQRAGAGSDSTPGRSGNCSTPTTRGA